MEDTTTEDKETVVDVDVHADMDRLVNNIHDSSTAGHTATGPASTAAPNVSRSKSEGHIDGATYENRQNGSNLCCHGVGS